MVHSIHRRRFLKSAAQAFGVMSCGVTLSGMTSVQPFLSYRSLKNLGPLQNPDALGLRLPGGFSASLLARSGQGVQRADGSTTDYKWHKAPDGGACFAARDGGWIYTSNSEIDDKGGAGALRFDSNGHLQDAYSILSDTSRNCAGGPTPWSTWLSCEERAFGRVFECDIYGQNSPELCEGLGYFKHEAVALDPMQGFLYLTEDEPDGRLYRYRPSNQFEAILDLKLGQLEVAKLIGGMHVQWLPLPNATPRIDEIPTRKQVLESQAFAGGEGIWYHDGKILFTTKGDNRVWSYNTKTMLIEIIYDYATANNSLLKGVDNIVVSSDGHILVAEDGGNMQIVVLGPYGDMYPLLQIVGQDNSEITGPAISPSGKQLYLSSQRGGVDGLTYQVQGPFS